MPKKKKEQEWFFSGEWTYDKIEAQEIRHEYAHSGFYTKIIPIPATRQSRKKWEIHLKNGPRLHYPTCCVEKKHWKVDGSKDKPTWVPRELAVKFKRKWISAA